VIYVIATVRLQPGARDEFLGHFRALVPTVLREEGCLEYGPTVDLAAHLAAQPAPRPDVVTVVEKWESLEHLRAHLSAPHMLAYRDRVKSLVQGTMLQILEPA
jgi:quinol monooxygenase YgiN